MVDGVAHEVVVDADAAVAALERVAAAGAAGAAAAAAALSVAERRDDELEAVGVGAPGVGDVLERDEVGAGEDEPVVAEAVHRLLAAQVGLQRKGEVVVRLGNLVANGCGYEVC